MEHLGEGCTYLTVAQVLRQLLIPCHQSQRLHGSHTVRNTSSECREGAFRRDESFENDAVLLTTLQLSVIILLIVETGIHLGIHHRLESFQIHRMEHVAAVVIESEYRTVSIPAITYIPLLYLAAGRIDAVFIEIATRLRHETLDGRREEQPVGIRRVDVAELGKLLQVSLLGHLIERLPECIVSTEETLGDIGCIYQVLTADAPAEIVRILRINGILVRSQRPFTQLLALLALGCSIIRKGEPWSHTCHQSAEALHIEHLLVAVVEAGTELCLHILLQLAFSHVFQYRLSHLVSQSAPIFTVALLLHFLLGRNSHERNQRQDESHHDTFKYIIHR